MENYADVVLTTRIRLARNVKGYKFTNNMIDKEKQELLEKIKEKLEDKYTILELNNMDDTTKKSLVETHTISKELLLNNNTGMIIDDKNNIIIMINEEDHLRIQAFCDAFDIDSAYKNILEADKNISSKIDYAYSDDYGYITACPTCIGTGMRVSVMLHLPALEKIGALDKVFYEISNLGVAIRGIYGENSNSQGTIYQISNQKTLGVREEDIIKQMKQITNYIVNQERKARDILSSRIDTEDEVLRSYGIAKYATLMRQKEAMQILSNIRMGVAMGLISDVDIKEVDKLMENIGINTLRKNLKEDFSKEEESAKRAEYIKSKI